MPAVEVDPTDRTTRLSVDDELCLPWLPRLEAMVARPDAGAAALCAQAAAVLDAPPQGPPGAVRVECLLALAHWHYLSANPFAALAPASRAAAIARSGLPRPLLRKALSFLGVAHMETGHMPAAVQVLSEALEVARAIGEPAVEAPVWSNLGLALQRSALHEEAMHCFERAAARAAGSETFAVAQRSALTNLASCALHLRDLGRGLQAARDAIAMNPDPTTAQDCLSRAIAESNLARLLLLAGEPDAATRHVDAADRYAGRFPGARGDLVTRMTRGLLDVHRGDSAAGLARLKAGLEGARRTVRSEIGDALSACVAGYEAAGQPDVALVYLHEILALNRSGKTAQVVAQQREHLSEVERRLDGTGGIDRALGRQRGRLRGRLADRELARSRAELLEQQAVAAELHDDATGEHCYRVGRLASILGREIGLEDEVCFLIDLAARLHDIGKLVVPDTILLKPGRLTPGEREIMETHTTAGADILSRSGLPQMHVAEEIARHHHERWDGGGYPARLAGTAIPIAARVTALADVFDALTHVRPYKPAWTVEAALDEIRRLRGLQFDPGLCDTFLALVPRLQREVGDLDAHLAAEARRSPFIRARRRIAEALQADLGDGTRGSQPPG